MSFKANSAKKFTNQHLAQSFEDDDLEWDGPTTFHRRDDPQLRVGTSFESVKDVPTEPSSPTTSPLVTGTPASRALAVERAWSRTSGLRTPPKTQTPSQAPQEYRMPVVVISDTESDDEQPPPAPIRSFQRANSVKFGTKPTHIERSSTQPNRTIPQAVKPTRAQTVPTIPGPSVGSLAPTAQAPLSTHLGPTDPWKHIPLGTVDSDDIPQDVLKFATSAFGTGLKPRIVAHSAKAQEYIDRDNIAWGTQYELARGVTNGIWTWEDIIPNLCHLRGSNAEAAWKVPFVMSGRLDEIANTNPPDAILWRELDREQAAIEEGKGRGLGLMGEWDGVADWFGGRVQQKVKVMLVNGELELVLQPLGNKKSHRFGRFYGSRRFLSVSIEDDLLRNQNDRVIRFLRARLIICGRSYVPFHPKDGRLYLIETNEDYERQATTPGDEARMTFSEFVHWHNPLTRTKNVRQATAKWSARFALGLSTSIPVLEFEEEDIKFIDDIGKSEYCAPFHPSNAFSVVESCPKGKKPSAEELLTDGCGLINRAALTAIVRILGYESLPAGVQARIDGAKGFWILHPDDRSSKPKIWIRDSQNKIANAGYDRAHRILDLLAPSRSSGSSTISQQSILNLSYNGVPDQVLVELMEEGIQNEIEPLLNWDQPQGRIFLWDAINKAGNVTGARNQRLAMSGLARALGLKGRTWGDDEDEDPEEDVDDGPMASAGRSGWSGSPKILHEVALELVQAGFDPRENSLLLDKLKYITKLVIDKAVEKFNIPIEESLTAYVVPDPLGVLEEGEIFYHFSKPRKDPRTECLYHVLKGDVVVGRYPIHLPCDMQKVRAVDKPELYAYMDVVVISTRGTRSLVNLLAGGDMDGDELVVIWDDRLVKPFSNKPFTPGPPDLFTRDFEDLKTEKIDGFCTKAMKDMHQKGIGVASEHLMNVLLAQLIDDRKGIYSGFHDSAMARLGYDHKETIRLAYIFTTLLDAGKTGHRLRRGIFREDQRKYPNLKQRGGIAGDNGISVLRAIAEAARAKGDELQANVFDKHSDLDNDRDLQKPWDVAEELAQLAAQNGLDALKIELSAIKEHVTQCRREWANTIRGPAQSSQSNEAGNSQLKKKLKRADNSLQSSRSFAKHVERVKFFGPQEDVLKASYAYQMDPKKNFAFSVAFKDLCTIKAKASQGGLAPMTRVFDEGRSFASSTLKALRSLE